MRRWFAAIVLLSVLTAVLTGCWDRIEIDQRGFVVGIAIDKPTQEKSKKPFPTQYEGTYQFIVPVALKQSSGGGVSAGGEAFFNITTTENSMMALSGKLANKTSRSPYFEHLKIIIISAEVARQDTSLADVLEFFLRDNEMRRSVNILISEEKASEVLNVKALNEKFPIAYIDSTLKNDKKSNYILPKTRIGDIHEHLLNKNSFAIQKINTYKQGISVEGAAIFDGENNRLVGFLDGEQTQGLNFMTGQIKGGILETVLDHHVIAMEVLTEQSKIKVQIAPDGKPSFTIHIKANGTLGKSISTMDALEKSNLRKLEDQFEQEIVRVCKKTIHVLQKKFKKDAIHLGDYLYKNHYKAWKPLMENWDHGPNVFSTVPIEVQASVTIKGIGEIDKSESN